MTTRYHHPPAGRHDASGVATPYDTTHSEVTVTIAARSIAEALRTMLGDGSRVCLIVVESVAAAVGTDPSALPLAQAEGSSPALPHSPSLPESVLGGAGGSPPARRPDESNVSYVQRLRRERGAVAYKPRDWAPVLALSAAEIDRAMQHGALPHRTKPDGLDHGAKMITAADMMAYLSTVDAVKRRELTEPLWWSLVHGAKRVA